MDIKTASVLILLAVFGLSAAGPAFGQGGIIAVYADPEGTSCDLSDPLPPNICTYWVVHRFAPGVTGAQFKVQSGHTGEPFPDTPVFPVTIGTAQFGVSIGYGECLDATDGLAILGLNYFCFGTTPACATIDIIGHPTATPPGPLAVDCDQNLVPFKGWKSTINGDAGCPCPLPEDGPPVISVSPASMSETLGPGETSEQILTIGNTGKNELIFDIVVREMGGKTALPTRSGDLMANAQFIGSFPDHSGNGFPVSIAYDGTYYWVVGGGFASGEVAQLDSDFELVATQIVGLDCRSVFFNPVDSQVYIKAFTDNGLFRLHTAPFDGSFDVVFTDIFQHPQTKVCISSDGTFMFDQFNGVVQQYEFSSGSVMQTFSLDLQHSISFPRGNLLAHTGDFLLTFASQTVYAYYPSTGRFVDFSNVIGFAPYFEWNMSYTNGLFFITDFELDTWYAFRIDTGVRAVDWLGVQPTSGLVPPGSSTDITITFDARDLPEGTYAADIMIRSNDPVTPDVVVPADLKVGEGCLSDGDINGDGVLTPGDALCAFNIFLAGGTLPPGCDVDGACELIAADITCDGTVTPGDALCIFNRFLAGLPPESCPICAP